MGKKRVARLMRAGRAWQGSCRRARGVRTTDSSHGYPVAPNVLARQFDVNGVRGLDCVWVSDLTYRGCGTGAVGVAEASVQGPDSFATWSASCWGSPRTATRVPRRFASSSGPARGRSNAPRRHLRHGDQQRAGPFQASRRVTRRLTSIALGDLCASVVPAALPLRTSREIRVRFCRLPVSDSELYLAQNHYPPT